MRSEMTPMERTLTTLKHQEPDRVPFFLQVTMHGAKHLGMSIEKYYSHPDNIVKGQLAMLERYKHDSVNAITYASAEFEAFGGSTIFYEDGPPNSTEPTINALSDIEELEKPDIQECRSLMVSLDATKGLKQKVGDVPVVGFVISPFSLPVMQMGFENYFDLMYSEPKHFEMLMKVNQAFCIELSNMLLEAGATAIVYFDPVSSATIIPRDKFIETGFKVAKSTVKSIKGPVVAHYASGRILPIIDKIIETGVLGASLSVEEDPTIVKRLAGHKLTLVGNLNGIEMSNWTKDDSIINVRNAINKVGHGGGFILSDTHGEIPFPVTDDTLMTMSDAAKKYGRYPLQSVPGVQHL